PEYDLNTFGDVAVEQGKENSGFFIRSSPDGARAVGGRVIGQGGNRTGSWRDVYDEGNGAGLLFENSPSFTVARFYCEYPWDGIRPTNNVQDWTITECWLNNIRDDAVENDHVYNGVIKNTFFDEVHTIKSARPGSQYSGPNPYHTLEFVGNVVKMGRHFEDRDKRTYTWSPTPNYSCGQFFKVYGDGNADVVMRDNIICTDVVPNAARSRLRLIPTGWRMSADSGNNIFVWLGGSDIPGLEYEEIDGVLVPVDLHIPQGLFSVTDDPGVYAQARSKWISEVWNGELPAPVEPPKRDILDFLQIEIDELSKVAGEQSTEAKVLADRATALRQRSDETQGRLDALSDMIDEELAG
ncbi:MAG: hypothetical protein AAF637_02540, partial [Pseudomonadota bacterium]